MNWLLIAIGAYFLSSIVAVLDKFILAKRVQNPTLYAFYIGIIEIFAVVLIPFGFVWPGFLMAGVAFISGALFIIGLVFLFHALSRFETSKVAPVVGSLVPVVIYLLSFLREDFMLTSFQTGALALLVMGGVLVSYRRIGQGGFLQLFGLAALAALCIGSSYFLAKVAYSETGFLSGFVLGRLGGFAAALSMLAFSSVRLSFRAQAAAGGGRQSMIIVLSNRALASLSFVLIHYATFLGNATLVQALGSVQYVFLIFLASGLSWKFPLVFAEARGFWVLARKAFAVVLIMVGGFVLAFSEKSKEFSPGISAYGVTFSEKYAKDMKLDWREAYVAMLDDLKVKKIRIPAYWDVVETQKGVYDFTDLDWQLEVAQAHGAKVVLSIGYRLPRWPECHIPQWAKESSRADFESSALSYITTVVERYKKSYTVAYWQVENEPFLHGFGECPIFDSAFFDKEIDLVKSLDVRPIIVSDSGELSLWFQAAHRADVFGTTMYRTIWNERVGYFTYPLPPEFFHFKANVVRAFGTLRKIIVIELQAEPWGPKMAYDLSPEEEMQSFSPSAFRDTLKYAQTVGFPEAYLWGVEWWYFKKTQGNAEYWEIAKELF